MARGGMRIGEVLRLKLKDLQDRKRILQKNAKATQNIIQLLYDMGRPLIFDVVSRGTRVVVDIEN